MKTHWKKLMNPDYIGAYALEPGEERKVRIKKVVREMVTGQNGKKEECTVAHLEGEKPFILNRTNCKIISKMYDSPYIEEWSGKSIIIYAAKVNAFGEEVEALRIRQRKPEPEKLPELNQDHPKWDGAKQALKDGNVTIEQIKKNFTVSNENLKALQDGKV